MNIGITLIVIFMIAFGLNSLYLENRVESFQSFYLNGKEFKCGYTPRQWEVNDLTNRLKFTKDRVE